MSFESRCSIVQQLIIVRTKYRSKAIRVPRSIVGVLEIICITKTTKLFLNNLKHHMPDMILQAGLQKVGHFVGYMDPFMSRLLVNCILPLHDIYCLYNTLSLKINQLFVKCTRDEIIEKKWTLE